MADEQKGGSLPNSIILAAVLATGALFYFHEAPLKGARPTEKYFAFRQSVSDEDIQARLWQDPFDPVEEWRERLEKNWPSWIAALSQDHSRSPMKDADEDTLVIGVTVTGSPYYEDHEFRRRLRYALLSGLDKMKYVPKEENHIGYFRPPLNEHPDLMLPKEIPYEWFVPVDNPGPKSPRGVLLLWLDEDVLAKAPLRKFAQLVRVLRQDTKKKFTISIIGPQSSTTLVEMAKDALEQEKFSGPCDEADPDQDYCRKWPVLNGVKFYAYGATGDTQNLLNYGIGQKNISANRDISSYFEDYNIILQRTIAADEVLARAIVHELKLRGAEPGKEQRDHASDNKPGSDKRPKLLPGEQHVALISEWDTFYGRTLPKTM